MVSWSVFSGSSIIVLTVSWLLCNSVHYGSKVSCRIFIHLLIYYFHWRDDQTFVHCIQLYLPARASEQGNVIVSVRIYIYMCVQKNFVIERTRDLIYLNFVATDFFPKKLAPVLEKTPVTQRSPCYSAVMNPLPDCSNYSPFCLTFYYTSFSRHPLPDRVINHHV